MVAATRSGGKRRWKAYRRKRLKPTKFKEALFQSHLSNNVWFCRDGNRNVSKAAYHLYTTYLYPYEGVTAYRRAQQQCLLTGLRAVGSHDTLRQRIAALHQRRIDSGVFRGHPPPFARKGGKLPAAEKTPLSLALPPRGFTLAAKGVCEDCVCGRCFETLAGKAYRVK